MLSLKEQSFQQYPEMAIERNKISTRFHRTKPVSKPEPNSQDVDEQQAKLRHDMGNILCVMRMRLGVLKRNQPTVYDKLDVFEQGVDRLTALLDGWRKLESEPANQHSETMEEFDLHEITAQILQTYQPTIRDKKQTLSLCVHTDALKVRGIKLHYERLIDNLISNACKYTPGGGNIDVDIMHQGTQIRFSVADNGIGIHKRDVPHVFESYYRTNDAQQSRILGSGLGLSIVKEIVDSLGGDISVCSQIGRGTTFVVTLPIV